MEFYCNYKRVNSPLVIFTIIHRLKSEKSLRRRWDSNPRGQSPKD